MILAIAFTPAMGMMLVLVAICIFLLIREVVSPEMVAMGALCALMVSGILEVPEALSVFSNPAPLTVGAMFILSHALQKTGVIGIIGHFLSRHAGSSLRSVLFVTASIVAVSSAFVNNTPIVAIFMPVLLGLARSREIPASKLLIPLSYASIMGGCCTLIGTSTNLIVSGVMNDYGLEPMGMFDLAAIGLPLLIIGVVYLTIVSPWLIPERQNITAMLNQNERSHYFCHTLVRPDSPLVGKVLTETELFQRSTEFKVIEVRRGGSRLMRSLADITIEPFDRIMISVTSKNLLTTEASKSPTLPNTITNQFGIENLSTIEGSIFEGVVSPHSHLINQTIKGINFRQTYGMLVLALHRKGANVSSGFENSPLQFGDTLLMLGPKQFYDDLRHQGDFMFLEDQKTPQADQKKSIWAILGISCAVALATFTSVPIVASAIMACVFVALMKCLKPEEAYHTIDWSILFLIYGMLSVGKAMEETQTAAWLAESMINIVQLMVEPEILPFVALALCYLLTNLLTEVLSNNATAVVMAPVSLNCAINLGVDPMPFAVATMLAASAAFITPIGYQTNTMVYGAGGYRFTDYVKVGIPLSIIFWITATLLIPRIWPFAA
ncbi:MAG: SLC13 family permease [Verrucomicrobiota bacterium]